MDRKRDKSQSERGKERQRASDICSVIFVTVSSSKQHGNGSVQDRRQTPLCARSSVQKTCNTTGKTGQGARRIKRTKTTSKEPTTLKEPTKTKQPTKTNCPRLSELGCPTFKSLGELVCLVLLFFVVLLVVLVLLCFFGSLVVLSSLASFAV